MKVLIVDDEPLARLRLRSLLQSLREPDADFQPELAGEASDADEALAFMQATPVDVVLLDIRMPGPNSHMGLRLAARLKALPQPPAVVFVTAHAEHALKAFELDAVDYLTKPVRRERLREALQRVAQRLRPATEPAPLEGPALVVSERGRLLRLPLAEVLYLKAEQKYVTVRTAGHSHLIDETLTELEQQLGDAFIRIHRNALVGRHAIRALELRGEDDETGAEGWAVRVAPLDEWLAVSRRQVAAVRAALAGQSPPA
ncbi:MAG: LytTR family DNA-binding domain-containing protein [Rubrivivax sp.]|nr:LytTR family DNA-binding domain-containing protein [Rubrivivax sp.]